MKAPEQNTTKENTYDSNKKCIKCGEEISDYINRENKGICVNCKHKGISIPKWAYLFLLLLIPLGWWLMPNNSNSEKENNTNSIVVTKTEEKESNPKFLQVNGIDIWVRNKARSGDVIMKINDNPKVKVLDSCCFETIRGDASYWYKIEHNGQKGWMFGSQTREHLRKESKKPKKVLSTEAKELYQKIKEDPSIVKFHGFGITKGAWDIYITENEVLYVNEYVQSSPISFTLLEKFNPNRDNQNIDIINYRNSYESVESIRITRKYKKENNTSRTHSVELLFDSGMYSGMGRIDFEIENDNSSFETIRGFSTRATVKNPKIGDFHEGGIVFWLDPNDNSHGLVCAITDNTSSHKVSWAPYGTTLNSKSKRIGSYSSNIGGGMNNTKTILTNFGKSRRIAAGLANSYRGGGYNDWFLPNFEELVLIFKQREIINRACIANGGSALVEAKNLGIYTYTNIAYWTSNESDKFHGQIVYYNNGVQSYSSSKGDYQRVRAVRAF
ncbi:hypothetical protein [Winogradskyella sp. A2]|uniref:hypothetical protein n=1 Tax=Winogradskyella sp. A2 TaxID=3366944 RepID=UPI00398C42E2